MSRQNTMILLAVCLILTIVAFLWLGCSCKYVAIAEGFEGEHGDLTPKQRELFEDLKNDKLSKEEMVKLVKSGILNENLINKFLKNLDAGADELAAEDKKIAADKHSEN